MFVALDWGWGGTLLAGIALIAVPAPAIVSEKERRDLTTDVHVRSSTPGEIPIQGMISHSFYAHRAPIEKPTATPNGSPPDYHDGRKHSNDGRPNVARLIIGLRVNKVVPCIPTFAQARHQLPARPPPLGSSAASVQDLQFSPMRPMIVIREILPSGFDSSGRT